MAEFYVFGNIRRALNFKQKLLNVSYTITLADGWTLVSGDLSGQSQFDEPQNEQFEGFTFELPFEVALKTTTLCDQPRICLKLCTLDSKGLKQQVAECEVFMPLDSQYHCMSIPCWGVSRDVVMRAEGPGKPQPGGSVIYQGDRACLLTDSAGDLELELQVMSSGLRERGIIV